MDTAELDAMDALTAVALNAHRCGEHGIGLRVCDRLLACGVEGDDEQAIRSARAHSTPLLADLVTDPLFFPLGVAPAAEGWSLFNPTILARDGGYLAIVRSSNYRIDRGRYVIPDEDGESIRTRNVLSEFDADFRLTRSAVIADPEYQTTGFPVWGLEDCRLRPTRSGVGVSATVRNVAPFDGRCRIATAELDVCQAKFHSLRVIESAGAQEHEKNWMPLVGKAAWLYSSNTDGYTLTVQEKSDIPDEYLLLRHHPAPPISRGFRGGSQLVPFRDGWICAVHEVAWIGNQRVYDHRLAWFTNTLQLARISQPFAFREQRAIEFAAGLAVLGNQVSMTFGVRDAEAWAVRITEDQAWALLGPIPPVSSQATLT